MRADVAAVSTVPESIRVDATLYGESASRVVVSVPEMHLAALLSAAAASDVPAAIIGRVGGDRIQLAVDGQTVVDVARSDADELWSTAIERRMAKRS